MYDRNDRKEMFRAICSECGDNCEVPFKPTGSKPVLCSSCFGKQGGNSGRSGGRSGGRDSRFGGRDNRRDNRSNDRRMHQAVCDDCGDNCQVPFRPTAGKPIYCDSCFGKHNDRGGRGGNRRGNSGADNNQIAREISSMNSKLDRLIILLDPTAKSEKKVAQKKDKSEVVTPLDLDLDVKPKADQPSAGAKTSGGKIKVKTVKKITVKKTPKKKATKKPVKKVTKKKK